MISAIIADDEPAVAEIITYFIDKNNLPIHIVGIAEDGNEALSLIQKEQPRLVFLDIRMPHKNGFEVMESASDKTRFIIITAFESFEYAQKALRLGADDILLKPLKYEQFIEAIKRAIGWQFTDNSTVNSVIEYIHNHFNQHIDLTTLAETFYTSTSQLARLFKKHTGMTIITYTHKVRIEQAQVMIKNGESIKEAALASGYESMNNFYKYYKQFTGETPGQTKI